MKDFPDYQISPLFDTEGLVVKTRYLEGLRPRRLLRRSPEMESSIITLVEEGVRVPDWEGLFYVMGLGTLPDFNPLYIGKTERKGVKNPESENIRNIRNNFGKFARWGDGLDYHIGDLSHAMFEFEAYRAPTKKYSRWAKALFSSIDPPILKESVYFYVAPWYSGSRGLSGDIISLPAVEKELIALASFQFGDILLNVDGR